MAYLGQFINMIYDSMQQPMQVYEFTFSFWDIFMFTCMAGIIFRFLGGLFK